MTHQKSNFIMKVNSSEGLSKFNSIHLGMNQISFLEKPETYYNKNSLLGSNHLKKDVISFLKDLEQQFVKSFEF